MTVNSEININKRIFWIDAARCICMLLVMLSHWTDCPGFVHKYINPFFLITFYFCSGYCCKNELAYWPYIRKKIHQLFVPWFLFSNANILLSSIVSFKEHESLKTELIKNMLQIRGYGDKLWFIACLFTAYFVFYYLVLRIKAKKDWARITALLLIIYILRDFYTYFLPTDTFFWGSYYLPWHIDRIPVACFYMMLGYGFKLYFDNHTAVDSNMILIVVFAVYVLLANINFGYNNIYMFSVFISFDLIRHLVSLAMIILLSRKIMRNRYMSLVGSNTIIMFSWHNKVQTLLEVVLTRFVKPIYFYLISNPISALLTGLTIVYVASLILIPIAVFIRKKMPWIIGAC